jgi:glycolate oxidase iron-sulfur subunit
MQTKLSPIFQNTPHGEEAENILRSCVHCGFCTATCPTYQLLGDERDGPRGRIYLIKQFFEGEPASQQTQLHLDRCLTCRSCETTCPSGVQYSRLLDIGREQVDKQVPRPLMQRLIRNALSHSVPYPKRMQTILKAGQLLKPVLPISLQKKLLPLPKQVSAVTQDHQRKMLVLAGCVQQVVTPQTNAATTKVFDELGIELVTVPEAGCCGAVSQHLSASQEAKQFIKQNIDAWWPHVENGVEAIVITASGCGSMVKEYGHLLKHDADYADKAAKVAELCKDIVEVLAEQDLTRWQAIGHGQTIAFHCPCSLQHGQQLTGQVEQILKQLSFTLTKVQDAHLCCGSAGTYSLLQPALSEQLKQNKLTALQAGKPDRIVTANIGCQMHLSSDQHPISHWIELIAEHV